jgi:hypothetical protein
VHEQFGDDGNGQAQSADHHEHDAEGLHEWILDA